MKLADAIKPLPHIQIVRVKTLKGYYNDSDKYHCIYLVGSRDSKKQVSRWTSSGTIDYPKTEIPFLFFDRILYSFYNIELIS